MTELTLRNLTVLRGPCPVVDDVSLRVGPGECVGLIGPNGAGKTTLMRAALGILPYRGRSNLAEIGPRARAKAAAWLPQQRDIAWPIAVETLVMLGRVPHLAAGQTPRDADRTAVATALAEMGLTGFEARPATALSGGEQARVLIARALAQQTPLLLADEPIAGLDPAHQIGTMSLFADLATRGKGLLVSLHDLSLAARHCTRLLLLHQGRLEADGAPEAVLTPENLARVFGIEADLTRDADGLRFQPLRVLR